MNDSMDSFQQQQEEGSLHNNNANHNNNNDLMVDNPGRIMIAHQMVELLRNDVSHYKQRHAFNELRIQSFVLATDFYHHAIQFVHKVNRQHVQMMMNENNDINSPNYSSDIKILVDFHPNVDNDSLQEYWLTASIEMDSSFTTINDESEDYEGRSKPELRILQIPKTFFSSAAGENHQYLQDLRTAIQETFDDKIRLVQKLVSLDNNVMGNDNSLHDGDTTEDSQEVLIDQTNVSLDDNDEPNFLDELKSSVAAYARRASTSKPSSRVSSPSMMGDNNISTRTTSSTTAGSIDAELQRALQRRATKECKMPAPPEVLPQEESVSTNQTTQLSKTDIDLELKRALQQRAAREELSSSPTTCTTSSNKENTMAGQIQQCSSSIIANMHNDDESINNMSGVQGEETGFDVAANKAAGVAKMAIDVLPITTDSVGAFDDGEYNGEIDGPNDSIDTIDIAVKERECPFTNATDTITDQTENMEIGGIVNSIEQPMSSVAIVNSGPSNGEEERSGKVVGDSSIDTANSTGQPLTSVAIINSEPRDCIGEIDGLISINTVDVTGKVRECPFSSDVDTIPGKIETMENHGSVNSTEQPFSCGDDGERNTVIYGPNSNNAEIVGVEERECSFTTAIDTFPGQIETMENDDSIHSMEQPVCSVATINTGPRDDDGEHNAEIDGPYDINTVVGVEEQECSFTTAADTIPGKFENMENEGIVNSTERPLSSVLTVNSEARNVGQPNPFNEETKGETTISELQVQQKSKCSVAERLTHLMVAICVTIHVCILLVYIFSRGNIVLL